MTNKVEWSEEFNIGVEIVDNAHKQLFSIVRRLLQLTEEGGKDQFACLEGIKYFKNYTVEHFAQEEAYMRSINYPGYAVHKQLHDNLRDKTLPALVRRMERAKYSRESVEEFLGFCIGWLTGHIMVEDRAITGKAVSKWSHDQSETMNRTLEQGLIMAIDMVFGLFARVFSDHYGGEDIGETVNFCFVHKSPEGDRTQFLICLEKRLALAITGRMLGIEFEQVDQTVATAAKILLEQLQMCVGESFDMDGSGYDPQESGQVDGAVVEHFFQGSYPEHSLLLETPAGRLAYCLRTTRE